MRSETAVKRIRAGNTVAIGVAEEIIEALEARYLRERDATGVIDDRLHNLTLLFAGGQGDGSERGLYGASWPMGRLRN